MNARGRKRIVDPALFTNEDLARCSVHARLLFIRLWTVADFRGVFLWRPRTLRTAAFPHDEDVVADSEFAELELPGVGARPSVTGMLRELCRESDEPGSAPLVVRFEHEGRRYGWITSFEVHQSPHGQEVKAGTKFPDPLGLGLGASSWGPERYRQINTARRGREALRHLNPPTEWAASRGTREAPRGTPADGGAEVSRGTGPGDRPKGAVFPKQREDSEPLPNEGGTRTEGAPPVSDSGGSGNGADPDPGDGGPNGSDSAVGCVDGYTADLAARAHTASCDPGTPGWARYWTELARRMVATGRAHVLEELLETCAKAADPRQRRAKGIGPLHSTGKFLTVRCHAALASAGWGAPGPPAEADADEAAVSCGTPTPAERANWDATVAALGARMRVE